MIIITAADTSIILSLTRSSILVVAQRESKLVGSNFLDERSPVVGIGPISVDPAARRMRDALEQKTATVVEHLGEISGYAALIGFFGHSLARTNRDLMALIAAAPKFLGPRFLLPTRNQPRFAWCLASRPKWSCK